MVDDKEYERVKRELDNLRKNKIIIQAKLKQKEDKITELTKKINQLRIKQKESTSSDEMNSTVNNLKEDITRSRKINKKLRAENASLQKQLEEARKTAKSAPSSAIQAVSVSSGSADSGELKKLKAEITKRDDMIASLNQELDNMAQGGGGSFTKIRQLNAKIRELRGQLDMAKKSEDSMKARLLEMNRKISAQNFEDSW